MKKGLSLVREKKVEYMDMFEDLKEAPPENEMELCPEHLTDLTKNICDDVQALQDLAKKHKTIIKDEKMAPT